LSEPNGCRKQPCGFASCCGSDRIHGNIILNQLPVVYKNNVNLLVARNIISGGLFVVII
jgi:hypothetical protein